MADDARETRVQIETHEVNVFSYRQDDKWHCTVDNVDPGANIARGHGDSREAAEDEALEKARRRLLR